MKKMIIAVLIGLMLIPAPMMARNDRGRRERPRVENRGGRRDNKIYKGRRDHNDRRGNKVVIVNRPSHRHCPPPPPPRHRHHHHHCDNDAAEIIGAAAALVGLIGAVSAIAY